MKNVKKMMLLLVVVAVAFLNESPAYSQAKFKVTDGGTLTLLGKSNVHDWEMVANDVESGGNFNVDKDNQLVSVTAFTFSLQTKSLKSGKSSMDKRTYKTLKADAFPVITYKLVSAVVTSISSHKSEIKSKGLLTIAGVTQNISMTVYATVNTDRTISLSGSEQLLMTDYKIDPPSFMLGAMVVKNDITIRFALVYKMPSLISKN